MHVVHNSINMVAYNERKCNLILERKHHSAYCIIKIPRDFLRLCHQHNVLSTWLISLSPRLNISSARLTI